MKLRVRYSLRFFLLCVTVIAIWLGVRTNAAIQQRRAVATITNAGGHPYFNWQLQPIYDADGNVDYFKVIKDPNAVPAPKWLRRLIGDEFFQHVVKVSIHPDDVNNEIVAAMRRLPRLEEISLSWEKHDPDDSPSMSQVQLNELWLRVSEQCPQASVWIPPDSQLVD